MANRASWGLRKSRFYLQMAAALVMGCASTSPSPSGGPVTATAAVAPAVSSENPATSSEPRGLSGRVRLADGGPAAGAVVALVPHFECDYPGPSPRAPMVVTDANGRYAFPASDEGHFSVTATLGSKAAGAYGGVHDLSASKPEIVDLELGRGGFTITGKVENAEGAPVSGARIEAMRCTDNEGEVYMTTTDAAGHYELQLAEGPAYFIVADSAPLPRLARRIDSAPRSVDFRLYRAAAPRPTDTELKAYLAEHALPLATLQPGKGTTDLAPLKKMIGGAHIVAIGEAAHGSAEFRTLWHRLIEFLASDLGFTTVAIESGWSDALALDDYVTTGRGDPQKALTDLYYWNINTEEFLALVRWMRRFNQDPAHSKKLHLLGFDVQFASHGVPALIAYLEKVDPPLAARAREFLTPLREPTAENTYGELAPAEQEKTQRGIHDVLARFDSEHPKWAARSGEVAWSTAREHAEMIRRTESVYRDPSKRDFAMAETVDAILGRQPKGTKMILLGHNLHMGAKMVNTAEMGQLLRERHGNDYFAIGTTFNSGSLLAYGMKKSRPGPRPIETFTVGAPPAAGLENALVLGGKSPFLLDLRNASGPFGDWLDSKISMRSIGGFFRGDENSDVGMYPRKSYDALICLDKITPSRLNPGAK